jgi:hypothetical protein
MMDLIRQMSKHKVIHEFNLTYKWEKDMSMINFFVINELLLVFWRRGPQEVWEFLGNLYKIKNVIKIFFLCNKLHQLKMGEKIGVESYLKKVRSLLS